MDKFTIIQRTMDFPTASSLVDDFLGTRFRIYTSKFFLHTRCGLQPASAQDIPATLCVAHRKVLHTPLQDQGGVAK